MVDSLIFSAVPAVMLMLAKNLAPHAYNCNVSQVPHHFSGWRTYVRFVYIIADHLRRVSESVSSLIFGVFLSRPCTHRC